MIIERLSGLYYFRALQCRCMHHVSLPMSHSLMPPRGMYLIPINPFASSPIASASASRFFRSFRRLRSSSSSSSTRPSFFFFSFLRFRSKSSKLRVSRSSGDASRADLRDRCARSSSSNRSGDCLRRWIEPYHASVKSSQ